MQPGYKTTEFWLALGTATAAAWLAYLGLVAALWAVASMTLSSGLYTLLRSALKAKTMK